MPVKSPCETIVDYICKDIVQIDLSEEIVEDVHFFKDDEGDLVVNFKHDDKEYTFVFCEGMGEVLDAGDYDTDDEDDRFLRRKYPVRIKNAVFRAKKILN